MCYSQATLLYGIWVTTSSLAFAATAHHDTRAPFAAIDMILERRQSGKLEVTRRGPSVVDVPPEIWEKVKEELLVMEIRHAEISAVDALRCGVCELGAERSDDSASDSDTPRDNSEWTSWQLPPYDCDGCWDNIHHDTLVPIGSGTEAKKLLQDYQLRAATLDPVSENPADEGADFDAISPISLPFEEPGNVCFPSAQAESDHSYEYAPAHAVATISPAVFDLPHNAERRFQSLVKTYHLDVLTKSDSQILPAASKSSASSRSAESDEEEQEKPKGKRRGPRGLKYRPVEPRWMLWSMYDSCGP